VCVTDDGNGLAERPPGNEAFRACACVSNTAINSVARPGGGRPLPETGSVAERVWPLADVTPEMMADRRTPSEGGPPDLAPAGKAPELGRDSSVRSVIRLKRIRGSNG
jgi:hypothetical protein